MANISEQLQIITSSNLVGTTRGAADICDTIHKTVKNVVQRLPPVQPVRCGSFARPNYELVRDLATKDVKDTRAGSAPNQTATPNGPCGWVHRLGPQLSPPRRTGEEAVPAVSTDAGHRPASSPRVSTWSTTSA